MKLNEIMSKLEEVAPVVLSDEFCKKYKMYDNSGIIINCGTEIAGALFSLELSGKVVDETKKLGYNLIVTHHPAIYGGISRFDLTDNPQSRALAECLKSGISVISMHLNFDAAPKGIDYYLMRGLGGENAELSAPVQGGGYGRVYSVKEQPFADYVNFVAKAFNSQRVLSYGTPAATVKKVASFCGAGCDEHNIAFAKNNGANVFVSSDMKHHEITALLDSGLNVIVLTHYCAENYGFNQIYLKLKDGLKVPAAFYCRSELL